MDFALTSIVSVIVGAAIGVLSGMLGIGGGTIIVPVLKLGYLLPPIVCTATSLLVVILTAVSGAVTHIRRKTCLLKLGVVAGIGGACMSPVGVRLASLSPDWAIMAAAAAVIVYSAVTMFRKALKAPKERPSKGAAAKGSQDASLGDGSGVGHEAASPTAIGKSGAPRPDGGSSAAGQGASPAAAAAAVTSTAPAAVDAASAGLPTVTARQLALGFVIGLVAGLMGGYVGVGGGFIMVPLFMQMLKTPMKLTSGTSLIAVLILAIPGVVTQALMGNIAWVAGIALAIGAIPGAVVGSHLVDRIPERTLRFLFSALLCVAAILLVVDQL